MPGIPKTEGCWGWPLRAKQCEVTPLGGRAAPYPYAGTSPSRSYLRRDYNGRQQDVDGKRVRLEGGERRCSFPMTAGAKHGKRSSIRVLRRHAGPRLRERARKGAKSSQGGCGCYFVGAHGRRTSAVARIADSYGFWWCGSGLCGHAMCRLACHRQTQRRKGLFKQGRRETEACT